MSTVAYPKCKFTTEYSKNNIVQYLVFTEYTMFNETVVYLTVIICMITEQYMRGTIRLLYGGLRSAQKQWEDKSKPFFMRGWYEGQLLELVNKSIYCYFSLRSQFDETRNYTMATSSIDS